MGFKLRVLLNNWRPIFAVVYPTIISAIPIYWYTTDDPLKKIHKEPLGCYVILLMSGYFMTECFPLAVTSLLPMLLFPLFGIVSTDEIASNYLSELIVFLFGGCFIALAFEYSNFHLRIALKVISVIGAKSSQILLGIILTSASLSMWMNNTSSTALMVPIVIAITNELKEKMIKRLAGQEIEEVEKKRRESMKIEKEILEREEEKERKEEKNAKERNEEEKDEEKKKEETEGDDQKEETNEEKKDDEKLEEKKEEEEEKKEDDKGGNADEEKSVGGESAISQIPPEKLAELEKNIQNLRVMFLLAAAYGSNIGGTGLLTGSGTNLIAIDQLSKAAHTNVHLYKNSTKCVEILAKGDFVHWMLFNVFAMFFNLVFLWVFLIIYFKGIPAKFRFWKPKNPNEVTDDQGVENSVRKSIKAKYVALGPMTVHEIIVLCFFLVTIALWVFRDPKFIPGWVDLFDYSSVNKAGKKVKFNIGDATSTMAIVILMTILPRKKRAYTEFFSGGFGEGMRSPILTWDYIQKKIPWGLIILLGGGSAMASGSRLSGLNAWITASLNGNEYMQKMPEPLLLLVVMLFCAILTTVSSNTATAAIVVPVLIELSFVRGIHPLYLALTVTTVCSYAFILPVSTPPNAIVYDTGLIKQKEMILPGAVITLICCAVLYLITNTLSAVIFGFFEYGPEYDNDYCTKLIKK